MLIKPCPYCGGEARLIHSTEYPSGDRYRVACTDCGATTWPRLIGGRRAIEAWNRRAAEDGGCGRCDHCRIPDTGTCRYGEED